MICHITNLVALILLLLLYRCSRNNGNDRPLVCWSRCLLLHMHLACHIVLISCVLLLFKFDLFLFHCNCIKIFSSAWLLYNKLYIAMFLSEHLFLFLLYKLVILHPSIHPFNFDVYHCKYIPYMVTVFGLWTNSCNKSSPCLDTMSLTCYCIALYIFTSACPTISLSPSTLKFYFCFQILVMKISSDLRFHGCL